MYCVPIASNTYPTLNNEICYKTLMSAYDMISCITYLSQFWKHGLLFHKKVLHCIKLSTCNAHNEVTYCKTHNH